MFGMTRSVLILLSIDAKYEKREKIIHKQTAVGKLISIFTIILL